MKNRSLLSRYALMASLLILSLHACIKDPGPDIPLPPKPEWVLTEINWYYEEYDNEWEPPAVRVYGREAYQYNSFHKPYLHLSYDGPDTSQMALRAREELFYDNRQRVTRLDRYAGNSSRLVGARRFYYSGNNRMPEKAAFYELLHGALMLVDSITYKYQDTAILAFRRGAGGSRHDTLRFSYNSQGNLVSGSGYPVYSSRYSHYDNAPNAQRFFNLDHGLALSTLQLAYPVGYPTQNTLVPPVSSLSPRLSANNWGFVDFPGTDPAIYFNEDLSYRPETYNSAGMLTSQRGNYAGQRQRLIGSSFEYTAVP